MSCVHPRTHPPPQEVLQAYDKGASGSPVLREMSGKLLEAVQAHEMGQRSAMAVMTDEMDQLKAELAKSETIKEALLQTLQGQA